MIEMAPTTKPKRTPVQPGKKPARASKKQAMSQIAALRVLAERTFVFNPEGVSLRELARQPEFKGVSNETLSRWSREDDWLQKRRDVFDSFRKQVERSIGQSMVTQARQQLALYDRVHEQFAAFILPDKDGRLAAQPKSAESAMLALLKIDEARGRIRRELASTCGETIGVKGHPDAAPAAAPFTDAQSREMAHVLMRHALAAQEGDGVHGPPLVLQSKGEIDDDGA